MLLPHLTDVAPFSGNIAGGSVREFRAAASSWISGFFRTESTEVAGVILVKFIANVNK
jgi:hypothetical protein